MSDNQGTTDADALAQVEKAEDDGWTAATADYMIEQQGAQPIEKKDDDAGKGDDKQPTTEEKKAADEKAAKEKSDAEEVEKAKNETPEETEARHKKEAEDAELARKNQPETQPDNRVVRDQRAIAREMAEDRKTTLAEVKEKLFKDVPDKLVDSDGDEIKTIEDVMQLRNKATGKAFTEEEAAAWLLAAQKHVNEKLAEANDKAEHIADVWISIKDQADNAREKYGELFKNIPGLQKKVWALYKDTLKTDEGTGLIIDTTMSLEDFYDIQLAPYLAQLEKLDADDKAPKADPAVAEKKKAEKDEKKKQTRADRNDIYHRGKVESDDPEAEGWEKAAKDYYEGN